LATKNIEKRNEILSSAYQLLTKQPYDKVSYSEIARMSGISKALLQRYYPQKIEIFRTLIVTILENAYRYMDNIPCTYHSLFQKLSDFDMLFFKGVNSDPDLAQFITSCISQPEVLDILIEAILEWVKPFCTLNHIASDDFRRAMYFSMGGSMHLYQHKSMLGMSYQSICRIHMKAIMTFLDYPSSEIADVLAVTDKRISVLDAEDFLNFCRSRIAWL